ncbi:MAG TPA: hypothetical protein VND96_11850 [Candidatus Micrarchaeaceae archaeon]|nr:hypothetical protein [Candidatus Micrarchaeaceae archaeon]
MDDFDRLIEFQLRRKLDPLVAGPVPVRRGRDRSGRPARGRRDQHDGRTTAGALVLLEHS